MEKLRKFERSCLRVALKKFRTPESNYQRFYSCQTLYNLAEIPRIDIFILNFTRNYIANTKNIDNNIIKSFSITKSHKEYIDTDKSGKFPPQNFIYFDKEGLIQDRHNIPIIYYMHRHMANKNITFSIKDWQIFNNRVYNTSLSFNDRNSL